MRRGLLLLAALPVLLAANGKIPELVLPIACKIGQNCFIQHYVDVDPSPGARDYHCGARTYDKHDGIDFRIRSMAQQRAGVEVLSAAAGSVINVRDGMPDISVRIAGKTSVAGKECGNGVLIRHPGGAETQYCHLARGSVRVKHGETVRTGTPLGRVGMSGDAEFPHLHFIVREHGQAVDPFAYLARPGQCGGGQSLWATSAELAQSYMAGEVINTGFAAGPVTMEAVQDQGDVQQPQPTRQSPVLVAFVQSIGLEAGDVQVLTLMGPDGAILAENKAEPLERNKAQWVMYIGKKRGPGAWPAGHYVARYQLFRVNRLVIVRRFGISLN